MKENTLLKVAMICSIIGLVVLYFVSARMELKEYRPSLSKNIGDDVKLKGTVAKITDKGEVIFIEVIHQNNLNAVLFTDREIPLKEGDSVEITGTVQEYNGKEEIIADEIKVIR